MLYNILRKPVNFTANINQKYFQSKSSALDEILEDERDWAGGNILLLDGELPIKFIINDGRFVNQNKEGYTMSCTAQGTCNAINNSLKIKSDKKTYRSGFTLFDIMVTLGLASRKNGAYVIDAIKTGKSEGYLSGYYTVFTQLEIKNAIYETNCIVTGSNKIDWSKCKDGLVKEVGTGYGHCFEISGWDNEKVVGKYTGAFFCRNSYGDTYQDKGGFWIPYALYDKVLFNTRKAIIVSPEWAKLSPEERTKQYKLLRSKYL